MRGTQMTDANAAVPAPGGPDPVPAPGDVVRYDARNGVAWLTIDRPEARNALSKAVREGLFAGVRRFNDDESAKVLVLTGAGDRAFWAGGDLKEMSAEGLTIPPVDFIP